MPRSFCHLRDGEAAEDPDGMYLPDVRTVRLEAIRSARDITAADVRRGKLDLSFSIEVTDEQGKPILAVPFREVIDVEP